MKLTQSRKFLLFSLFVLVYVLSGLFCIRYFMTPLWVDFAFIFSSVLLWFILLVRAHLLEACK